MEQLSDTKQRILDVSLKLFSQNGYSATSVREIARNVGVRESAIYNHFRGKDDIIETLFNIYGWGKAQRYIDKLKDDNKLLDDPKNYFKSIILDGILDIVCNEEGNKFKKVVMMEMFCTDTARNIVNKELFSKAREYLSEIFNEMMSAGVIKRCNPFTLSNQFLAPLMFINLEYLLNEKKGVNYFKKEIEAHIDFFWQTVSL
ncbi:TetR/AcrR family transcriptional regulator [Dethiothermospora halolimnae]|uniref:TetR/AcrR family transcriptional regulator n=1 Tax=Dethiothermospora halolimnae TaxID=3114390 RepID=UPI003CCB7F8B